MHIISKATLESENNRIAPPRSSQAPQGSQSVDQPPPIHSEVTNGKYIHLIKKFTKVTSQNDSGKNYLENYRTTTTFSNYSTHIKSGRMNKQESSNVY